MESNHHGRAENSPRPRGLRRKFFSRPSAQATKDFRLSLDGKRRTRGCAPHNSGKPEISWSVPDSNRFVFLRVGLLRQDARSSSRRNRTVAITGMSCIGAQHGLPFGRAISEGLSLGDAASGEAPNPRCFYPGFRIGDGNRTRVVRLRGGCTSRLYDTDMVRTPAPRARHDRGNGWVRTNIHPVNNRPLSHLSFAPKCRLVRPAAVVGRAFAQQRSG